MECDSNKGFDDFLYWTTDGDKKPGKSIKAWIICEKCAVARGVVR